MDFEKLEQSFVGADWEMADHYLRRLLVGSGGGLWTLASGSGSGTADDPVLKLLGRERVIRPGCA